MLTASPRVTVFSFREIPGVIILVLTFTVRTVFNSHSIVTIEDLIKSLLTILHAFWRNICSNLLLYFIPELKEVFFIMRCLLKCTHLDIFVWVGVLRQGLAMWLSLPAAGNTGMCYNDQHNLTIWPSPIYQCSVLWPAVGVVSKALITAQYAVMKHLLYCLLRICCFGWSFKVYGLNWNWFLCRNTNSSFCIWISSCSGTILFF